MQQTKIVEMGELSRFVLTGVTATVANLGTAWLSRGYVDYPRALVFGVAAGFCVSFLLMKVFAFRSREWNRAPGEAARFVLVYSLGLVIYGLVSMIAGGELLPRLMPRRWAEMIGLLAGAGTMTVTSYLGHRFYTYRRSPDAA